MSRPDQPLSDFPDSTVGTIRGSNFSGGTTGLRAAPTTGTKSSKFEVRDCVIADNIYDGVAIDGTSGPVLVSIVSSLIAGNGHAGIEVDGAANSVYVSDSTITRNYEWGLFLWVSGTVTSGLDNRLINNYWTNGAFTSSVPEL